MFTLTARAPPEGAPEFVTEMALVVVPTTVTVPVDVTVVVPVPLLLAEIAELAVPVTVPFVVMVRLPAVPLLAVIAELDDEPIVDAALSVKVRPPLLPRPMAPPAVAATPKGADVVTLSEPAGDRAMLALPVPEQR